MDQAAERNLFARARLQHGPFTVQQARDAGVPGWLIRERVATGAWQRLHRGVYVARDEAAEGEQRRRVTVWAGWLAAPPGAVLSHQSAAAVWGLPGDDAELVHLTVSGTGARARPGLRLHRAPLPSAEVARLIVGGLTTPERTVVDLARSETFGAALAAADAALRQGCARRDAMARCLGNPRRRGHARAVRVVEHADARSESALESRGRAVMIEYGVPLPELQVELRLPDGRLVRVDYLWRGQRVVGEADGRGKYETLGELSRERERERALVRAGYRLVRVDWRGVTRRAAETARDLRAVLTATP